MVTGRVADELEVEKPTNKASFMAPRKLIKDSFAPKRTILPYVTYMCGTFYLGSALLLDSVFLYYVVRMMVDHRDELAKQTFRYSIIYLTLLFVALFIDHYAPILVPAA